MGRPSDPFHPERWSNPPPTGARPIIPCEDPPDETSGVMLTPLQGFRETFGEPEFLILPTRRVTPAEERARLARAALIATIVVFAMIAAVLLLA
jgi:hypothetical protein